MLEIDRATLKKVWEQLQSVTSGVPYFAADARASITPDPDAVSS